MKIPDFSKLTRAEKELLLIKTESELQRMWGNPPESFVGFFDGMKDEDIEEWIIKSNDQIKFNKNLRLLKKIGWIIVILFGIFAFLGIIGLLVFGIKQLF